MRVDFRTILNFLSGETDGQAFVVRIGLTENVWRHEYVLSGNPRTCVDDKIRHAPILFVKIERVQSPNIAVCGVDRVAL
jgi:hypothetical protein